MDETTLAGLDLWWRAANYLSVGQIYLMGIDPLLREPLTIDRIKPRLLGHWGTTPGLNFVYAHLNRVIRARDLDMIYVCGPGHGGPGMVASAWLEGSYSELVPNVPRNLAGMGTLFRQFSFPGGIPSHDAPNVPGSINEGGELGYSMLHAAGAVFDNPDLVAACVVGDGEAETGALATSWHCTKFLNPKRDGAVLPILHLNGYKIAGPTVLARIPEEELLALFRGYGWAPVIVAGHEAGPMHAAMAAALDAALDRIAEIRQAARDGSETRQVSRQPWPMIILRTPKGWTGPKFVDNKPIEGTWRAHQVPLDKLADHPERLRQLEDWMRSYRPEELFEENGHPVAAILAQAPAGVRRMGMNPHANGGLLLRDLDLPAFKDYAVDVPAPGRVDAEGTQVMGTWLRDVMARNMATFRLFGPDETSSNRLQAVFEVTPRESMGELLPTDEAVGPDGRVMEVLSEHCCQGWLEGYLLTGRHGLFSCYEAFIHIIDSMFNQHAKWLEACQKLAWRRPIASLNYLLTSHVWRQDHNGFSHQDPGFIGHVANKKASVVRIYLPPDANTLLSVTDHCLRSRNYVNVIVAGKQPSPQWLTIDEAVRHCAAGAGLWDWASNDHGQVPDVVMACAGDVPTMETLAAVDILRRMLPDLRVRVVNVVDLMALQPTSEHPHGLSQSVFESLFTRDKPVIFAFHGYPWLVHRLIHGRACAMRFHVHGFNEEGTTTTPFDMTVLNGLDRFTLAMAAIERVERMTDVSAHAVQHLRDRLVDHHAYVRAHGLDLPEVREWRWGAAA
jgi:xylulose-5-phosphate/fructose-6-phosphate phosphoketolase